MERFLYSLDFFHIFIWETANFQEIAWKGEEPLEKYMEADWRNL